MANNPSDQEKNMQKKQSNLVIWGLAGTLILAIGTLIAYLSLCYNYKIEPDNKVLAALTGIITSIIVILGRAFMHMVKRDWR